MFFINKIVGFFSSPLTVGLLLILVAGILTNWKSVRRRRWAKRLVFATPIVWLWIWACPLMTALIGMPLESQYLENGMEKAVETYPACDAIVILGGGMGAREDMRYPNMYAAADRVWQGVRLYKAGKAPRILVSGSCELQATVPLLIDFGVPRDAILVDNTSRNTYENARYTERLLKESGAGKKVLLVTSAWHMTRARGNFEKTELDVIPAPSDYEATYAVRVFRGGNAWKGLLPSADALFLNSYLVREWIGRLARR